MDDLFRMHAIRLFHETNNMLMTNNTHFCLSEAVIWITTASRNCNLSLFEWLRSFQFHLLS